MILSLKHNIPCNCCVLKLKVSDKSADFFRPFLFPFLLYSYFLLVYMDHLISHHSPLSGGPHVWCHWRPQEWLICDMFRGVSSNYSVLQCAKLDYVGENIANTVHTHTHTLQTHTYVHTFVNINIVNICFAIIHHGKVPNSDHCAKWSSCTLSSCPTLWLLATRGYHRE